MPGVTVDIRNHATNQVFEAVTDERGRFRILYLPVGDYHLSAQLSGFTTANVNLSLAVGDQIDVPIVLKPAAIVFVDTVVGDAPLVETRRTELASAITPHEVDSLPLNGRNYLDLALLAPNVSRTNLRTTDRFAETSAIPGTGVSVAGQRNLNNNFVVDGLSANDDAADLAGMYLSQEVVREFEVVTSGGGAEFGRASSGTISVVTQSGTQPQRRARLRVLPQRHRSTRRTRSPSRKDPLNQNQFGLTLRRADRPRPDVLVRQPRADAAGSHRHRHHRAGVGDRGQRGARRVRLPRAADHHGQLPDRLHRRPTRFGRVDHQAASGPRLQVRYNLYNVTSAERAQRRRPQRRQPRRRARRHRSHRGRQLSDDARRPARSTKCARSTRTAASARR